MDAFYTNVTAEGVKQGLESLESGGISPKFIIVDDGWQSVGMDLTSTETKADDSAKYVKRSFSCSHFTQSSHITPFYSSFANRLIHIKENHKFQKNGEDDLRVEDASLESEHIVSEIEDEHSVSLFLRTSTCGHYS